MKTGEHSCKLTCQKTDSQNSFTSWATVIIERISIELTNRCDKACWFCYNHSQPVGATQWQLDELIGLVSSCQKQGTKAVSFGGGEPLQYPGVFELLRALDGVLFRSLTTNGLQLNTHFDRLVAARPDKVHLSIHFPERKREVVRVLDQVADLTLAGIRCGINLLVSRKNLADARSAASLIRSAGIGNDRIVYLPMRISDTPSPEQMRDVAGQQPFQSMTCLKTCGKSKRFCSVGWDKSVAWCSYTTSHHRLATLDHRGIVETLSNLDLIFCGGIDEAVA